MAKPETQITKYLLPTAFYLSTTHKYSSIYNILFLWFHSVSGIYMLSISNFCSRNVYWI